MSDTEKALLDSMRAAFNELEFDDSGAAAKARKILSDAAWDALMLKKGGGK